MKTLHITQGLPGSGKSSWAKRTLEGRPAGDAVRVNRDLIRENLHFSRWSKDAEDMTVEVRNQMLRIAMRAGLRTVISDDTNLNPAVVDELMAIAAEFGYQVLIKDFTDVPLSTCIDRDARREGTARVGADVILKMHKRFLSKSV